MHRRWFLFIFGAFLITSLFVVIRVAEGEVGGPIYIRADGAIDPPSAAIERNGDLYTFTDSINGSIVVERSNIVIDGDGFSLEGNGTLSLQDKGIFINGSSDVTIRNLRLRNFYIGIDIRNSLNNTLYRNLIENSGANAVHIVDSANNLVAENNITKCKFDGIILLWSENNSITENHLTNCSEAGVRLDWSPNNTITRNNIVNGKQNGIIIQYVFSRDNIVIGNNITNNEKGVGLNVPGSNTFFHNNFVDNTQQVRIYVYPAPSDWDNGFEGNYWSDYKGSDLNHNGLGDTEYEIDPNYEDCFPLMGMFTNFNATSEHDVQTICNSTISGFQHNGTAISFNVTGENSSAGFCRICIPTALMSEYQIFVNGTEVDYNLLPVSNSTHSYLYFTYQHSTKEVLIIPELHSLIILPLFMLCTLLTTIIYRRKRRVCA